MLVWILMAGCTCAPPKTAAPTEPEAPLKPLEPSPAADLGEAAGLFRPVASQTEQDEIDALESLGYTEGETPAPPRSGVVLHQPERMAPGLTLWCSGHGPEAFLMEADGTIVHRWRRSWAEVFGDGPIKGKVRGTRYWRRVEILPDQGLLAIFEGHGLVRLDRDSNVVWSLRERIHHDLEPLDDGSWWVLARKSGIVPEVNEDFPVVDDRVLTVSLDGEVLATHSLLQAFLASPWGDWLEAMGRTRGDVFHTNSVFRLRGPVAGIPGTRAGQALVSFRAMHTLAIFDLEAGTVVWVSQGPWRGQHDAQILPSGTLLLFDNFGAQGGRSSAVRELVPSTLEPVWAFEGSTRYPFYSTFMGAAQRLPNGNTLVSDGWVGRAFEVTPAGERVWEFVNPHRAADEDGNEAYIAVVPQMTRLAP